jgi:predicted transcriptional regulator of viral defense system
MDPQPSTVAQVIARIARDQHGVVTRAQLLTAGVSADEVKRRATAGALIRVHRGVYRVGHRAPSVYANYMAAVLACGPGALLSGRAAGHLLDLLKRPPSVPEVRTNTERRIEGVSTVRTRRAMRGTIWFGIPVTTPAQTLVDLAPDLDDDELPRACHEAGIKHETTPRQVEAVLGRSKGAARLRAVLAGDAPVTLSALERRFLSLIDGVGLPRPITNKRASTKYVDCRWPDHHLTVELDSYQFHNSRHSWEQDRRRDREAYRRGDQLRRYTYDDVVIEPSTMLTELAELLMPRNSIKFV